MVAEVIINSNVKTLNKTFDYNVPAEIAGTISIGQRVLVPFGRNKKLEEGFVINLKEKSNYKTKDIAKIEEGFFLTKENVNLAIYMAKRYFCNISDCIKLMLPPGTTTKEIDKRISEKNMNFVYLKKEKEEILQDIEKKVLKSEKQIRALKFLIDNDGILKTDVETFTDTNNSVIKALEKKEYIEIIEKQIDRNPFLNKKIERTQKLNLTEEQQIAYEKIEDTITNKEFKEFLLYGVTGSRKNRNLFTINRKSYKKAKKSNSISSRNFFNTTNGKQIYCSFWSRRNCCVT